MTTSTIDGTVEEAVPGRSRRGVTVYKSIRFQLKDGSSRTVTKAVVKQPVGDELQPGSKGRFYLFKAFDISGIHGVRTPDGRSVYAFPSGNEKIFLFAGIANLAWIALRVFAYGDLPLLGVALLALAVVGWTLMSKGQTEARKQFDGDAGYTQSQGEAPTRPL